MMTIEVGKYYIARDGCKVRIYAIDGEIHGAWCDDKNNWHLRKWYPSGIYESYKGSLYDIVSEWVEPENPKKLQAWINIKGGYVEFYDREIGYTSTEEWRHAAWLDEPLPKCEACKGRGFKTEVDMRFGQKLAAIIVCNTCAGNGEKS